MADQEPFSETVTVAETGDKKTQAGKDYKVIKSTKGLVFNCMADKYKKYGGVEIGKTFVIDGTTLPPKEGYTHGSRWVNSFKLSTSTATPPQSFTKPPQNSTIPPTTTHEGWRSGQALNKGVEMAHACGTIATDPDYWPKVFAYADQFLDATYTYEKGAGKFSKDGF